MAGAARFAPDERVVQTAQEAVTAALTGTEPYKRVAATAWPVRALIERDQQQKAAQLLPRILELSATIENPVSRSDALFLLWQAVFPARDHRLVLGVLVESCAAHWKADYILRQVALILASDNWEEAQKLAASMPEGKYKSQAQKRLAAGQKEPARQFF